MKRLCSVFMAILFFTGLRYAAGSEINLKKRTPRNAALRSALLPGWGQAYNHQGKKSIFHGSTFYVFLTASNLLFGEARIIYNDYEKTGLSNGDIYADYETKYSQARTLSYMTAGIWLYGIIDAYRNVDYKTTKQTSKRQLSVELSHKPGLRYTIYF